VRPLRPRSRALRPHVAITIAAAALVATSPSCRAPTQIEVRVETDVDCAEARGVAITIGAPGSFETMAPSTVTTDCRGGTIGTIVAVPGGARDAEVGVKIVLGRGVDADACAPPAYAPPGAGGDRGCVVARRRLRYLPHTPLVLPIALRRACTGVECDEGSTCFEGACRPADVDPSRCLDPGGCGDDALFGGARPPTGGGGASGHGGAGGHGGADGHGGASGGGGPDAGSDGGGPEPDAGAGGGGPQPEAGAGGGGPQPDAGGAARRVFVTSAVYTGALGGLDGADAHCVELAAAAKLVPSTPGSWRAWLSDRKASPSTRWSAAALSGPWVRLDGQPLAQTLADLAKPLENPVLLTESGADVQGTCVIAGPPVWTKTNANGTSKLAPNASDDDACADFTTTVTSQATAMGFGDATSVTWLSGCNTFGPGACSQKAHLYCFEQ
jgi:hypothetical protein